MTKRAKKKQRVYRKSQQKGCENATKLQEGESSRMGDNPHECKELSGKHQTVQKDRLTPGYGKEPSISPWEGHR